MKKTYVAPEFEKIVLNTRDILFFSPTPDDDDEFWTKDY